MKLALPKTDAQFKTFSLPDSFSITFNKKPKGNLTLDDAVLAAAMFALGYLVRCLGI